MHMFLIVFEINQYIVQIYYYKLAEKRSKQIIHNCLKRDRCIN